MFIIKIHNFFIIFTGDEQHVSERQNLLTRLLDAVKQVIKTVKNSLSKDLCNLNVR